MHLRRELFLWIGAVLLIELLTAAGAVGLFGRMTPAVAGILEENVRSTGAVERMLAVLAGTGDPSSRRRALWDAFAVAKGNLTEAEEGPLLEQIEADLDDALVDEIVRRRVVASLMELARINQASMHRADERAQRLGIAGAWAAVALGMTGLFVGVLVLRRLDRRLVLPLQDLHEVLSAASRGEGLRRAHVRAGPKELQRIGEEVDRLLDERLAHQMSEHASSRDRLDRAALLRILDAQQAPIAILDAAGGIVATNTAADARLDDDETLRRTLGRVPDGDRRGLKEVVALEDGFIAYIAEGVDDDGAGGDGDGNRDGDRHSGHADESDASA